MKTARRALYLAFIGAYGVLILYTITRISKIEIPPEFLFSMFSVTASVFAFYVLNYVWIDRSSTVSENRLERRIKILQRTVTKGAREKRALVDKLKGAEEKMRRGSKSVFLKTTQGNRCYREEVKRMIDGAARNIDITSPRWDNVIIDCLMKAQKRGCKIRVVTRSIPKNEKTDRSMKWHHEAMDMLREISAVCYNPLVHCRMAIIDGSELVCGSADFTADGLENNREAGILTNDSATVADAVMFFDSLWRRQERRVK
jgi:hypothetical protein